MAVVPDGRKNGTGNRISSARLLGSASDFDKTQIYTFTTSITEDFSDILGYTGVGRVPKKFSPYVTLSDSGQYAGTTQQNFLAMDATVSNMEVTSGPAKYWHIEVQYVNRFNSTFDITGGALTNDTPPWKLPPFGITSDTLNKTIPFDLAYDENNELTVPVQATSGTPLLANTVDSVGVLRFSFNVDDTFDTSLVKEYRNSVNSTSITVLDEVYPPETAKFASIKATFKTQLDEDTGGIKWQYYQIDIEIQEDRKSWIREFANRSTWFLNEGANEPEPIYVATAEGVVSYGSKEDMKLIDPDTVQIDEPMFLSTVDSSILITPISSDDKDIAYLRFYELIALDWLAMSMPETKFSWGF